MLLLWSILTQIMNEKLSDTWDLGTEKNVLNAHTKWKGINSNGSFISSIKYHWALSVKKAMKMMKYMRSGKALNATISQFIRSQEDYLEIFCVISSFFQSYEKPSYLTHFSSFFTCVNNLWNKTNFVDKHFYSSSFLFVFKLLNYFENI